MNSKLFPALQLTDACNKRCRACLRIPGTQSHKLSYADFERYLKDVHALGERYEIAFQFVTGGEPTIWKDGDKDVGDLLIALSRDGRVRNITMPTNGNRFEDAWYVSDLVERVSRAVADTVIFGVSIADYQENFIEGRCVALENLLEVVKRPGNKVFPVALVTLSRSDDLDARLKKSYPAVIQRITPLAPLGAGQEMRADCPSLCLSGSAKQGLGTYLRTRGVLEAVEVYKEALSAETRKKLDAMFRPDRQVSVAYRGCMVCRELANIGVWK